MGCTVQGVFSLLWDGRERLAHLEYKHQQRASSLNDSELEMLLDEPVLAPDKTDGHV
jgi:hypothetical protein